MADDTEKLATGSIYLSIDSMMGALLGGIFWIILAKLADPSIVGTANIVVALVTVLITFAGFGFNLAASKFIAEHNSRGEFQESGRVYSRTIQVTVLSSVAIAIVLLVFSPILAANVFQNPALTALIIIGAISLPFQSMFRALYGVYQGCQRMAYCLASDMVFLSFRLALAIGLVILGYGALGIVLGFTAGYAASTIIGLAVLVPSAMNRNPELVQSSPSPSHDPPDLFRRMFNFSLPNYFAGILLTGQTQAAILILGVYRNPSAVAFFNIVLLTKMIVVAISTSIGLALLPTVSATISRGDNSSVSSLYNLSLRSAILLSAFPSLVFFLVPDKILNLISGEYAAGGAVALQLLTITVFGAVIYGVVVPMLNSLGRPMSALWATALANILGFTVAWVLIPLWGIEGAAVANLVPGLAGAFIAIILLARKGGLPTNLASIVTPLAALGIAVSLGEFVLLQGFSPYLAVSASLLTLLGSSLALKALTIPELVYISRLVIQTLQPLPPFRKKTARDPSENETLLPTLIKQPEPSASGS